MSAWVDSVAPVPSGQATVRVLRETDAAVQAGVLATSQPLTLHHGGRLHEVRIAWRLVGPAQAPVVCALGGISADRYVCLAEPLHRGWWSEVVGPGRALDTDDYRVLSFDYLAPAAADAATPPSISSYDQAHALALLLDHLGIGSLAAIVGGSYGGMVALAFGERHAARVDRLIVIGAADRSHPLATAWRAVQRRTVEFAVRCGRPAEGLKLARALAMTTYRTPHELAARFGGPPTRDGVRFSFPVEEYLLARGAEYAARHQAQSFLCLSESIDLHRVEATQIAAPTTVVATREDQLVPLEDLRALAARLPRGRLHEISSVYGHDAFLKESQQLRGIFRAALGSAT